MSNAPAVPPPLTRRSVEPGPKRIRFAIRNGETRVGTILATTHDDALAAFAAGRPPMPAGLELRAYAIVDLDAERTR